MKLGDFGSVATVGAAPSDGAEGDARYLAPECVRRGRQPRPGGKLRSRWLVFRAAREQRDLARRCFQSNYRPQSHVDVFALRAVPACFGAATVPLAFSLARQFGCSRVSAVLVGGMVLLDGALLVEARLVLTDSSLFFWELLQLLAALRAADAPPNSPAFHRELLLTGVAIGAAVATKWTALATMAVVGLESIRSLAVALGAAIIGPASAYRRLLLSAHYARGADASEPTTAPDSEALAARYAPAASVGLESCGIAIDGERSARGLESGDAEPAALPASPRLPPADAYAARPHVACRAWLSRRLSLRSRCMIEALRPFAAELAARFAWLQQSPLLQPRAACSVSAA